MNNGDIDRNRILVAKWRSRLTTELRPPSSDFRGPGLNEARSGRFGYFRVYIGDALYDAGDPLDLVWLKPLRAFIEVVIESFEIKAVDVPSFPSRFYIGLRKHH